MEFFYVGLVMLKSIILDKLNNLQEKKRNYLLTSLDKSSSLEFTLRTLKIDDMCFFTVLSVMHKVCAISLLDFPSLICSMTCNSLLLSSWLLEIKLLGICAIAFFIVKKS